MNPERAYGHSPKTKINPAGVRVIGTIFASPKQLEKADAFADAQKIRLEREATKKLSECEKRVIGGEIRFYSSESKYAVASRSGKIIWFEIRADGYSYAIK